MLSNETDGWVFNYDTSLTFPREGPFTSYALHRLGRQFAEKGELNPVNRISPLGLFDRIGRYLGPKFGGGEDDLYEFISLNMEHNADCRPLRVKLYLEGNILAHIVNHLVSYEGFKVGKEITFAYSPAANVEVQVTPDNVQVDFIYGGR